MSRRELSLLVTRPNVELVGSVDGLLKFAWLRKSKISALNCAECVPFTATFLNTAMSHWYWPGPYMLLRGVFPKVPGAGFEYAVGLNQKFWSLEPCDSWWLELPP